MAVLVATYDTHSSTWWWETANSYNTVYHTLQLLCCRRPPYIWDFYFISFLLVCDTYIISGPQHHVCLRRGSDESNTQSAQLIADNDPLNLYTTYTKGLLLQQDRLPATDLYCSVNSSVACMYPVWTAQCHVWSVRWRHQNTNNTHVYVFWLLHGTPRLGKKVPPCQCSWGGHWRPKETGNKEQWEIRSPRLLMCMARMYNGRRSTAVLWSDATLQLLVMY